MGIRVAGKSGSEKSTVSLDGLKVDAGQGHVIETVDSYVDIVKFDNLILDTPYSVRYIKFTACPTVSDVNWNSIKMQSIRRNNVDVSTCNSPAINITGSGAGFIQRAEIDPNNILNWPAAVTGYECAWKINPLDSNWANATNWDNCANGRAGVPDQYDLVSIPVSSILMPVISSNQTIFGFGPFGADDGGKAAITSGSTLGALFIENDVTLEGSTTTCTDCVFSASYSLIVTDATFTMGKGLKVLLPDQSVLTITTANTHSRLRTLGGGVSAEWPVISTSGSHFRGVIVGGNSTLAQAHLDIDGLTLDKLLVTFQQFWFASDWTIEGFDNFQLTNHLGTGGTFMYLNNCVGATIVDATWSNITLPMTSGVNIKADGTFCTVAQLGTTVSVTGGGSRYGAAYETDPNNVFSWP